MGASLPVLLISLIPNYSGMSNVLFRGLKAREDLSSCGFKKQGSVQWICLGNEVVFELGSSRFAYGEDLIHSLRG